jgi:glucose-6-phosphate-specific signal transduction histidine kinase
MIKQTKESAMESERLGEELAALHQELSQVVATHEKLDPRLIQSLEQVVVDVQRVLRDQRQTHGDAATGAATGSATGRPLAASDNAEDSPHSLQELAEQFSVDYPETAALLNRLGLLLGNMGL